MWKWQWINRWRQCVEVQRKLLKEGEEGRRGRFGTTTCLLRMCLEQSTNVAIVITWYFVVIAIDAGCFFDAMCCYNGCVFERRQSWRYWKRITMDCLLLEQSYIVLIWCSCNWPIRLFKFTKIGVSRPGMFELKFLHVRIDKTSLIKFRYLER